MVRLIWSLDIASESVEGFTIEKDARTGTMTVDVGSGDYGFQALWY